MGPACLLRQSASRTTVCSRQSSGSARLVVAQAGRQCTTTTGVKAGVKRRDLGLASVALAPLMFSNTRPARAEPAEVQTKQYIDSEDSFSLSLPAGWEQAVEAQLPGNSSFQGSSGARRTLAWYSSELPADQTNITLTITNTSAEFTKLGSFGNVFAFGTNLVNSMDRSFLLRVRGSANNPDEPIQIAKLLDAADTRGMYYVEYTVEKQPGPKRHLYSLVALSYNGRYNRLYTLTAQCLEEQVQQVEPMLKQVLKSFVPPAGTA